MRELNAHGLPAANPAKRDAPAAAWMSLDSLANGDMIGETDPEYQSATIMKTTQRLSFGRLPDIPPGQIIAHMSDPRVAAHMPLLTFQWNRDTLAAFIAAKEECWRRDGLGHWAILCDGDYVGWGGFQKEGDEWDFGLVLKPEFFGLGPRIVKTALAFARADTRVPYVTFLLPPSRPHLRGLAKFGARFVGEVEHEGASFRKYVLETTTPSP
ncbi:GNAT family N-acetyltransferase [Thalassospiraceae bacterium LMO-JJ14]|nr:GNAT family N-acetyltransferase [Thalassospiraceae bacterium LMO-JJ14]